MNPLESHVTLHFSPDFQLAAVHSHSAVVNQQKVGVLTV